MFLVASVLVPATALAAGSGTLSASPATVTTSTGTTFTVDIYSQATTSMSGAAAAVDFDNSMLQIVSVARGADWNQTGVTWVEPSVSDIAIANATKCTTQPCGHMPAIAAFYTDNTSNMPAATATKLATVTFFATATGTTSIGLPVAGNKGGIIDGAAATYGTEVVTTSTPAAVTISNGTGSVGQGQAGVTADITGSVAAPRLALTCPASVTVPLIRNANNQAPFECSVDTDGTWTLSVKDTNPDANHGHMVDLTKTPVAVLANSLHVNSTTTNVDLAAAPDVVPLYNSQASATVPLNFTQTVAPSDKPGAYGMSVMFSIVNTF
jgi:hypothetical protein